MMKSPAFRGDSAPYISPAVPIPRNTYCTQCGQKLVSSHRFCPNCGSSTERKQTANQCVCGAAFSPQERYCFSCGKSRSN